MPDYIITLAVVVSDTEGDNFNGAGFDGAAEAFAEYLHTVKTVEVTAEDTETGRIESVDVEL